MSSLDFSEVLGKAWRIIWKHKVLWIFGVFAGCARGSGGGGGTGWEQNQPFSPGPNSDFQTFLDQTSRWIGDHLWIVILLVLVVLILVVLAVFLGTIGKIGLIRGTFKADGGAERLHFGELFRESLPYFWRVFLLSFLIGLAFAVILIPLVLFGVLTLGVGVLCVLPLICILIPLGWAVSLVVHQADAAMVIENLGIRDGVRRGWEVVKKNVGPILLIWLITAVIGFIIGVVLVIPAVLIVVPAIVGLASSQGEIPTGLLAVAGLCFVVYLPVLMVAQGILTAYIQSVWALTFLRLTRPTASAGIPSAPPAHA